MKKFMVVLLLLGSLAVQAQKQKLPQVGVKRDIKELESAGEYEITTTIKISFLWDLCTYEDVLPLNDSMKITLVDAGEAKFKNFPAHVARFSFTSTGSNLVLKTVYKVSGVSNLQKDFPGEFKYIFKGDYYSVEVKPEDVTWTEVK